MNVQTTKIVLKACIKKRITPMVWGKHGIGKSQVVKQIGIELGFDEVVDLRLGQMEVGDLIGMPVQEYYCPLCHTTFGTAGNILNCPVCKQNDKKEIQIVGRTIWLPPSWFPQNGTKKLLFFDELNRGRLDVQQAAFQIVLDRRIHTHIIPDNCGIVCACNPSGADYYVQELDPALLDRFLNIKFTPDTKEWFSWARNHEIISEVIDFIATDERFLGNEAIDIPIQITPTPRAYERLSAILPEIPRQIWGETATCIIGESPAVAFIDSLKDTKEKPIKATQIFNEWDKKLRKQVEEQVKEQRIDLLRYTMDEILEAFGIGKQITKANPNTQANITESVKFSDEQLNNVGDFLMMIPDDLAFSMLKDLASNPDINKRLLIKRTDLFDRLKKAWAKK